MAGDVEAERGGVGIGAGCCGVAASFQGCCCRACVSVSVSRGAPDTFCGVSACVRVVVMWGDGVWVARHAAFFHEVEVRHDDDDR